MSWVGDIRLGDTIDVKFCTVNSAGAPTVLTGSPVISAYVGNGLTQITAGITLTADFDGVVGLNNVRVVATSGNGFATATNVQLVITTGTVGGVSVVGYVVAQFSIEARSALMSTTAARTLDVSAGGEAGVDWANIGSPTTANNLSATNIDVDQIVASVSGAVGSVTGLTAATVHSDLDDIQSRLPAALVSGRMDSSVGAIAADAITAASIATGAIDADAIAADAATEIRSLASGTSDSGTTTTMVDAARTEADTDYWKGQLIVFTSGNIAGQAKVITAFTPATDTITFAPATTQAVATQTYEIWPVGDFLRPTTSGRTVNVASSGEADASITRLQGVAIATPTVGGVLEVDVTHVGGATTNVAALATNVDAILTDTAVIGAAGAGLTDLGGMSTTMKAQVNAEVVDTLATDTYAEPAQGAPAATTTLANKIAFLYKAWRNKSDQTATLYQLYNDDAATVDHKATVSDDATTFTKGEVGTGP